MGRWQLWLGSTLAVALSFLAPRVVLGTPSSLDLEKLVRIGEQPAAECALGPENSIVQYCYTITNTDTFTATNLIAIDNVIGQLPVPITLAPGMSTTYKTDFPIFVFSNVTNTATATALINGSPVTDTESATTYIARQLVLTKTVDLDGDCIGGSQMVNIVDFPPVNVTYCYKVTNPVPGPFNFPVTYTMHSLVDSVLGTITINPPCTLAPGQMCVVSTSAIISDSIKNTATWTSISDTVPLPCGVTRAITNSTIATAMVTLMTPPSTPTDTPTNTPTTTPTGTSTPTGTPVSEGGTCADTSQCAAGLFCVDSICATNVAPAPAASRGGLMIIIGLLFMIGTVAVLRLRRDS